MAINKKFLAEGIAENYEVTKVTANRIVDHVFSVMAFNLGLGNDVDVNGFGKFVVTQRVARTGRNPSTGESVEIPAKLTVKFKPAKALKDELSRDDPLDSEGGN